MKIEKAHIFFCKKWRLISPQRRRAIGLFETKEIAIARARLIAGAIYIHDASGKVEEKIIVADR